MARPQIHFDTTRLNLHVPNKLLAATKALAASRGSSITEITRAALREYVVRELQSERDVALALAQANATTENRGA